MKVKLNKHDILKYLQIGSVSFDTYVSPIINLANQYAHGTRPTIVGQMTELIQHFDGKSLDDWKTWYLERKPLAIERATEMIFSKLQEFLEITNKIDKKTVKRWIEDLVIVKTFVGLRFQEAILKKGAELKRLNFCFATPEEESIGIDGFIGNVPVFIKPDTYKFKKALPEVINIKTIYYSKSKDGLEIDNREIM